MQDPYVCPICGREATPHSTEPDHVEYICHECDVNIDAIQKISLKLGKRENVQLLKSYTEDDIAWLSVNERALDKEFRIGNSHLLLFSIDGTQKYRKIGKWDGSKVPKTDYMVKHMILDEPKITLWVYPLGFETPSRGNA